MKSPTRSHFAASLVGGAVVAGTLLALGVTGHGNTETIIEGSPFAARPAATGGTRLTAHAIYERDAPGVVFVRAQIIQQVQDPFDLFPAQERSISTGSGFLIDGTGDILTNYHVIEGANRSNGVSVQFEDNVTRTASVVDQDANNDLALLKVNIAGVPEVHPLVLGDSTTVQVGDPTLAIGNPFGLDRTLTSGIVSALQRQIQGPSGFSIDNVIQTDAPINPGNSGGALVDANGNLTGINTAIFSKSGGSQGIGFAIPIKLAMEVMKSIIEHGQVIRGWLGIEVQPLTQELAESFGLSGRPGIVVAGIFRDGPAQKAGLQLGDVILSIDGEPASDGRRSMNQVARIKPTDKVVVQVIRNGKELKLTAEIGLRPPPAPVKEKEEE
jgi:serine protease DegS